MKRALKKLLQKLEVIQEQHNGLGDTNIRDHMGDHVLRAFLRPEPGYVPTKEYGLDPEANRKVAAALTAFCKAAEKEAQKLGLATYEQRVAAFQDPQIVTASGSDFNDFFGVIELEPAVSQPKEMANKQEKTSRKPIRRAYVFDRSGSLDELLQVFNQQNIWSWQAKDGGAMDNPYIEARPEAGAMVQVREGLEKMDADGSIHPPEHGFMALLEVDSERMDDIDATFRKSLSQSLAVNIAENSPYWW